MKNFYICLILCVSFVIGVSGASAEEITIATFNADFLTRPKVHVKFGLPFDLTEADEPVQTQWGTSGFRDQKFTEAAKAVASVIAGLNADVVALVEVGIQQDVDELNQEIAILGVTYPHVAVCQCTDTFTQQKVAVLSRIPLTNILPTILGRETYDTELDDPEEERDTGISKGFRVTFQSEEETFHLYVVHLSSERGGHEQDAQRIAQASIVRRHYLPLLDMKEHIIVAGDLNDRRGQPTLRRIRGRDDIGEDLIQTGHVKYFKGREGTRWTYEYQGLRQQLDYILISQSIKQASHRISAQVRDQPNELASDHRPFLLTLELK